MTNNINIILTSLYPHVFVIPRCRHITHRTAPHRTLSITVYNARSVQRVRTDVQHAIIDNGRQATGGVFGTASRGLRGMQTLMLRPTNTDQWCALDVSVRAFCDGRERLSDHSNNAGSTAVTPTQGAAAPERSTVHPSRPVDTVRAPTAHTAAG
jgi:hypothetical protein